MATIFHQVVINASPQEVYEAIALQEGIAKWWINDCKVKPEVGFMNEFHVEGHGVNRMKVVDLIPGSRVEWECLNDDDEWTSTRITFEIELKGDASVLQFKQAGWQSESEFFATCNYHWGRHLGMLVELCETGKTDLDPATELKEVQKVVGP